MRTLSKKCSLLLALALLLSLVSWVSPSPVQAEAEPRSFTDSLGRVVKLPAKLERLAPSGTLAQIVLFSASPEKLVGLSKSFSPKQLQYLPAKYGKLPEFGQFYGKNANLNLEALLAAKPDVIIDIGQSKKNMRADLDKLQEQLQIPCVFIEAKLTDYAATYDKLAELLGESKELSRLSAYCQNVSERLSKLKQAVPEDKWLKVYWAMGEQGCNTNAKGSFQAEVLDLLPVHNVAEVELNSKGGGSEVSFEQLLLWQPTVLIADNPAVLELIKKDANWQQLEAVQAGRLLVPTQAPYNILANPPSVNRLLGALWLADALYPQESQLELGAEFQQFYQLFYHAEITEAEAAELQQPKAEGKKSKQK